MNNSERSTAPSSPKALFAVRGAVDFFDAALGHVQSKSIRAWAEKNRAAWVEYAAAILAKRGGSFDAEAAMRFGTYITVTAMG